MTFEEELKGILSKARKIHMQKDNRISQAWWDGYIFAMKDAVSKSEQYISKERMKEVLENFIIEYQEDASTKWATEDERKEGHIRYDTIVRIREKLGLE